MNLKNFAAISEMEYATTQPRRVLVVDDDEFIRQINYEILLSAGYDVDMAEDGAQAWDALQLQSYDLLVTDNQMPNVSGVALVEKIRTAGMALPVVMATGTLPGNKFIRQHLYCPVTTLLKPYNHTELLDVVETVLNPVPNVYTPAPDCASQPLTFGLALAALLTANGAKI